MKRIRNLIIIFAFLALISPLAVHAYFEFNSTKDAEIVMKASVLSAFGRLPDPQVDNWGKDPDDPFLIQSQYHLKNLELLNNRGELDGSKYYFRLLPEGGNTLDMKDLEMKSIGTPEYPFRGVFDGNGKIIKDVMIVADSGEVDIGFFGNIAEGGSAFNLILESPSIISVGNYVPSIPNGHATAKSGSDKEKCHIGVFCGHLDGEANNISIKDAVIDINSPAPNGSGDYMDYYSKYSTVGFCGDNATIEGVLVSSIAPNIANDGDTGYWLTDFFYDNINQPVTYTENGNTYTTNYLAGLLQNPTSSSVPPWILRGGRVVPAEGIFEYHTGGNSNQYYDRIESIPTQTKVNYYDSTGVFKTTVDLTTNYDFNTNPDEFWIRRDLYNPYNNSFINSFKSGLSITRGINASASTLVHQYTGNDITAPQRNGTGGIYFKFNKLTAANPTAKVICAVYVPSGTTTSSPMYLYNAADAKAITGYTRQVPPHNSTSGAVNVHVYEFTVTQTLQELNTKEYMIGFDNSVTSANPRILYISVGGQHDNEHVNTQKYAELPTIDFIYDTGIPVSHSSYVYTKILPYFLNGSHTAPVDELKLEFTRTPGTPNNFTIDAWGKDAAIGRTDYLGNTIFDYISRFPDDNFILNRHAGISPSMVMLSSFGMLGGAPFSFDFIEEPEPDLGDLVFTLYTDREGLSAKAPLPGAVFRITGQAQENTYTGTAASDGNGLVSFTGIPCGKYLVEQINAPAHHNPVTPFYVTLDPVSGSVTKFGDGETGITGTGEVTNFIKRTSFTVTKTGTDNVPIGEVWFDLYRIINGTEFKTDEQLSSPETGEAVFTGLMGGETYIVKERDMPQNFYEIGSVVPDVLYAYVYF